MLNLEEQKQIVINALEDLKAVDIRALDVQKLCDFTDIMVICSGTSNRHSKSLADNVIEAVKKHGIRPIGIEGIDQGEWILVDLGDIVVNIMIQQTRDFYQLEQLWSMQPE